MVLLCLYKQWHHLQVWIKVLFSQGTIYLYPSFAGYIRFVSLLFPLICPHKVVHNTVVHCFYIHQQENSRLVAILTLCRKTLSIINVSPVQLTSVSALLSYSFPLLWPHIVLAFNLSRKSAMTLSHPL